MISVTEEQRGKSLPKKLEIVLYDYRIPAQEEDLGFGEKEPDLPQRLAQGIVQTITEDEFEETPEWQGAGDIYEGTTVVGDSAGAPLKTKNYNYGAYVEYFPGKNQVKIHLFQQKK